MVVCWGGLVPRGVQAEDILGREDRINMADEHVSSLLTENVPVPTLCAAVVISHTATRGQHTETRSRF